MTLLANCVNVFFQKAKIFLSLDFYLKKKNSMFSYLCSSTIRPWAFYFLSHWKHNITSPDKFHWERKQGKRVKIVLKIENYSQWELAMRIAQHLSRPGAVGGHISLSWLEMKLYFFHQVHFQGFAQGHAFCFVDAGVARTGQSPTGAHPLSMRFCSVYHQNYSFLVINR